MHKILSVAETMRLTNFPCPLFMLLYNDSDIEFARKSKYIFVDVD